MNAGWPVQFFHVEVWDLETALRGGWKCGCTAGSCGGFIFHHAHREPEKVGVKSGRVRKCPRKSMGHIHE